MFIEASDVRLETGETETKADIHIRYYLLPLLPFFQPPTADAYAAYEIVRRKLPLTMYVHIFCFLFSYISIHERLTTTMFSFNN